MDKDKLIAFFFSIILLDLRIQVILVSKSGLDILFLSL